MGANMGGALKGPYNPKDPEASVNYFKRVQADLTKRYTKKKSTLKPLK